MFAALALTGCESGSGRFRLTPALRADIVTLNGSQYVPLKRACDVYGIKWEWDTFARKVTLTKGAHTVVAMAGSDQILVNGSPKRLPRPVRYEAGTVYVPVTLVGRDLMLMVEGTPPAASATASRAVPASADLRPARKDPSVPVVSGQSGFTVKTVVLDAGHGGKDIGALGRHHRLQEKDYALAVARKVRSILERAGVNVVMTREGDTFIPLPERAAMANKLGADLFVSIHINSSRARILRGFECYYLSDATDDSARSLEALENSALKLSDGAGVEHSTGLDKTLWDLTLTENRIESAALAENICAAVEGTAAVTNRGVKTAKFYVLKHTNMPSVLVEVCYLSNRDDETKLKNASFQDRIAEAVARGVAQYKKDFERTEGFTKL